MEKHTIEIMICALLCICFGCFVCHEFQKPPAKPGSLVNTKQEKQIKTYQGEWVKNILVLSK